METGPQLEVSSYRLVKTYCPLSYLRTYWGRKISNFDILFWLFFFAATQKEVQKLLIKSDTCLLQEKSIAQFSPWSILQYFLPSLSYHLSLRSLCCLFLSGCFRPISYLILYNGEEKYQILIIFYFGFSLQPLKRKIKNCYSRVILAYCKTNVLQNAPLGAFRNKEEHSAILSSFIKLPFDFKIFVLSVFEWLL